MAKGDPSGIYDVQPFSGNIPQDSAEFVGWVTDEFRRLAAALQLAIARNVEKSFVAPSKPRDGMVVFADGVKWNPGSGQGFYGFYNSAWHFLG